MQLRISGAGFGGSLLVALILLGDLLGSSADSTQAFTEQFDDAATRIAHIAGGVFLGLASVSILVFGIALRNLTSRVGNSLQSDLVIGMAAVSAASLLVAASLVSAPSLIRTLGELTDDPGMEANTAAGVAQAGTIVLVFTMVLIGALTVVAGRVARDHRLMPKWLQVFGWIIAALTVVGLAISTLFPLGLYWLVVGGWLGRQRIDDDALKAAN